MSDNYLTIQATTRTQTGKGYNRKLRASGKVAANLLDSGKSYPLELDPKLLSKVYKGYDKKFNLDWNGATKTVSIQELQIHPVSRKVLHLDLMYVK